MKNLSGTQLLTIAVRVTIIIDIAVPVIAVSIDIAIRIGIGIQPISRTIEVAGQKTKQLLRVNRITLYLCNFFRLQVACASFGEIRRICSSSHFVFTKCGL